MFFFLIRRADNYEIDNLVFDLVNIIANNGF